MDVNRQMSPRRLVACCPPQILPTASTFGALCCILAFGLSGCGRRHNVEPGDPDYPALNPSPKVVIHLKVIAPPSIPTRFLVAYDAHAAGGPIDSPSTCSFGTGMGVIHWFGVTEDVSLKRDASYQFGDVVIDKYLPGRCNYQFTSSWFLAPDDQLQNDLFHFEGGPHPPTARIDIWCVTAALAKQPNKQCAPLWLWRRQLEEIVTPEVYDQIVSAGGDKGPPIFVGPGTQMITVQFHDLSAADGGREMLAVDHPKDTSP
jgi:hypothetical protein